ncbi:MAG: rod shape-determining protein MreD [Actinomycetota bacterium]
MRLFRKFIHFIILILFLQVQVSFAEYLKMYSVSFDLVMVTVVCIALLDGALTGMVFGFISGMFLDLMVGNIVGISAFIYTLNAFLASRVMDLGIKRKAFSLTLIIFLITEVNIFVESMLRYLFNFNLDIMQLGREILIKPIFSIGLVFLVFPLINWGQEKKWILGFRNEEEN